MSLAEYLFEWAWAHGPLTQLAAVLALGWLWVFAAAWFRAGESLRGETKGPTVRR